MLNTSSMSAIPAVSVPPPPPKRVVGLVRVSTAGQAADDRGGIPRQREVIRRTIESHQLDCLRVYELTDVSGTEVRNHPDVIEIIQLVASGVISGLVISDLDRLFRPDQPTDYAILQTFKDTGAIIYSGDTTYDLGSKDGMLFSGIRATIAGYELALIKERMHGAKEAKRKQGKCPTNRYTLPLGASYDRAAERFCYNEQISLVQELFRLVDEEGIRNYTEMERRTGVRSVTIPHLLRNRLFIGERVIDEKRGAKRVSKTGRVYRVKVARSEEEIIRIKVIKTPAVCPERFERVQRAIEEVRFNHHEARERDKACNLGTGVARCGYCGSKIYCSSKKNSRGNRTGYYYCRRNYYLFKTGDGCPQSNIRQPKLDSLLEAFTVEKLTDSETLLRLIEESIVRNERVIRPFPTAKPQLEQLEKREARLLDALEAGALSIGEFRERRAKLKAQRALVDLPPPPEDNRQRVELEKFIVNVVRGAFALKRLANPFEKKAIILALFSEVFFKDNQITAFRFNQTLPSSHKAAFEIIHLETPFAFPTPEPEALPEGHRRCSTCKEVLSVERFYKKIHQCRPCVNARASKAAKRRRASQAALKTGPSPASR